MPEQLLEPGENLLLYGSTNAGKTTQLRKVIEVMATPDRPARVFITREPSTLSILRPLKDKKLVELEYYDPKLDPIVWIDNATQGNVYRDGKWVSGNPDQLSLIGFDSLSGMGDLTLNALGSQAARGFNVGGEPSPALKIQADGREVIVTSGSRSHYLVAQRWLLGRVWDSMMLPVPQVWTAHEDVVGLEKKAPDGEKSVEIAANLGIRGVIGPMVAGSALTANLPKYFVFTFRLGVLVAENTNKHVMYTGNHKDGQLQGIANARCDIPVKIDPTDVPAALRQIRTKLK